MRHPRPRGKSILLSLALLFAAAPSTVAARQKPDAWVRVEPEGGGFSVLMPSQPEVQSERVPMMGNTYTMRTYTAADAAAVFYTVLTQDLPSLVAVISPAERIEAAMDGFREGFAEQLKASPGLSLEMKYQRDLDLGGDFGRQYAVSVGETGGVIRAYVATGPRVFLLLVLGGKESDANVARFFGSFKIDNSPPPPAPGSRKPAAAPSPTPAPTVVADPVLFPPDTRPIPYGDPKARAGQESSGDGGGSGVGVGRGVGRGIGPGRGIDPAGGTRQDLEDDDPKRVFNAREVTRKAVLLSKPKPNFTEEARRNDAHGVVRLRLVLGADGGVSNISVVKGLPDGLTVQAIEAAKKILFKPAQKDGRNVSQWITIDYNFDTRMDEETDAGITRKSVILEKPQPAYTEEARRNGVEGRVRLKVLLSKDGRASVDRVVEGLPHGLTEQAVKAAARIKFTPAEVGGQSVSVVRTVEYLFSLK